MHSQLSSVVVGENECMSLCHLPRLLVSSNPGRENTFCRIFVSSFLFRAFPVFHASRCTCWEA